MNTIIAHVSNHFHVHYWDVAVMILAGLLLFALYRALTRKR